MSDDWQYRPGTTAAWPAGWYADPWYQGQQRYWDGSAWTPHTSPSPSPFASPGAVPSAQAPDPATTVTGQGNVWAPPGEVPASAWAGAPTVTTPVTADPPPPWGTPSASQGTDPRFLTPLAPTPDPWPAVPPAPPAGSRKRSFPWVAVLAAMVIVAVIAAAITVVANRNGKSSTASPPTTRASGVAPAVPTPTTTAPTPTTIPGPQSLDPAASRLPHLAVGAADVPSGTATGLITAGNQVNGSTTLDLCNGTYPSEAQRTARYQTAVADNQSNIVLSTEAVLYRSPGGTAQAFTELRSVSANCPPRLVTSPVGEPAVKTVFAAAPDGSWPTTPSVERLAFAFTSTDASGTATPSVAVYLRRGRVLMGVYFSNPTGAQPSVGGQTTIPGIVNFLAGRMAKLPASVILGSGSSTGTGEV